MFKKVVKNNFVLFIIVFGVSLILFSLIFDLFGGGKGGIGPAQIAVIDFGVLLTLLGVGFTLGAGDNEQRAIRLNWMTRIPSLPNVIWVVSGFFIAYMIFLILPMFFNPIHRVVYFNKYLPDHYPIGWDFTATMDSIRTWFAEGTSKVYYPPLVNILFAPLLLVSYPINYYMITVLTVISYFLFGFLLPFLIVGKEHRSVVPFIFGISIFSYGLQFELERGQFHTIALLLCISAVYLFHRHPQYRFFAYLLFCVSVQFKIYPALFFVMFVDDWRDWKTNIKRFVTLGLVNFLLLFLLGYSYFSKFITHIIASSTNWPEAFNVNHSIAGFLYYLLTPKAKLLDENSLAWLQGNINLMINLFLAYFILCFAIVWVNSYRRNIRGIDSLLVMACILGGLLIPAINHDYTLPLLTAPFALIASEAYVQDVWYKRIVVIILLVISSFTYAVTLIPFLRKPLYLWNSFPLLIILLTTTTLLSFFRKRSDSPVLTANDLKENA